MFAFRLATQAVDSAGALLDIARVPIQIMMDYMPAVAVKINPLTHYAAAD